MRSWLLVVVVAAGCLVADTGSGRWPVAAAAGDLQVTSAGDAGEAGGAVCPHTSLCTLRRAIEAANADASGGTFTITFAPSELPTEVAVGNSPLPNITRSNVVIDGTGAGVLIRNNSTSLTAVTNGLTATGAGFALRNVAIHGFLGACLALTGDGAEVGAPGAGNAFGGCGTGIAIGGKDAVVRANLVGFTPTGGHDPVSTGIVLAGGGNTVGGPASVPGSGNFIGNAGAGVHVGSGTPGAFSGNEIERNTFGEGPDGSPAPLERAVFLAQPSNGTIVLDNSISNVSGGVAVAADASGVSVINNRISGNAFSAVSGLAIDLGNDGQTNPNDAGDGDAGPNGMLNHPVITRATQSRVTGTACVGCQVELYVAFHRPGGASDYGSEPLPGGVLTTGGDGQFSLDNPAVAPGDWLIATATDAAGNTSEFGPSARVGAGSVLCGNVQLRPGWNHVGYFGPEPVSLLSTFTPVPSGAVTAIYRFVDGQATYERWFSATAIGRTLTSVEPGESYWFYAETAATLPGGFSLSFPLPVQLEPGWNDFVYLGATASAADALSSLGTHAGDIYHFDTEAGQWERHGAGAVPAWAQDFDDIQACEVYQVHLDQAATLVPLQP